MGVVIDREKNEKNEPIFSADDSAVKLMVIPTNEELEIASQVEMVLSSVQ
jgi:acetate kinase